MELSNGNLCSEQFRQQGNAYLAKNNFNQAEWSYRHAVIMDPGNCMAHMGLAFTLHAMQHIEAAEECVRSVILLNPEEYDAHYLLGTILLSRSDNDSAIKHLTIALDLHPEFTFAQIELCNALAEQGRFEEAKNSIVQALTRSPSNFYFHFILGKISLLENLPEEAITSFHTVLSLQANHAEAHYYLGIASELVVRPDEAIKHYRSATTLNQDFTNAYLALGALLKSTGDLEGAVKQYQRAITLDPASAETLNHLGAAHVLKGDLTSAEECFRKAISTQPETAEFLINLGIVCQQRTDLGEAEICFHRALSINPNLLNARYMLATVLLNQHKLNRAKEQYETVLELYPEHLRTHHDLGNLAVSQGRLSDARIYFDKALSIDPAFLPSIWHRSMLSLLQGDFETGLPGYEYRWQLMGEEKSREFRQPLWLGESCLAGKSILLHAEKGFGDTIQFIRYAREVTALGATAYLEVQAPLKNLLADFPDVAQVISRGEALPPFDFQCPLMSLPLAFKTTLASIPHTEQYLYARPDRVEHWSKQLSKYHSPRIGIVWSGNPTQSNDCNRSMELKTLLPIFNVPGLHFFSLNRDVRAQDLPLLRSLPNLIDLSNSLTDFIETAAIIENLDLVISVDTAVSHLTGAMGKPLWVLLSYIPDWRWFFDRPDCPWYPSAKLVRQNTFSNWDHVIQEVILGLNQLSLSERNNNMDFKNARPFSTPD